MIHGIIPSLAEGGKIKIGGLGEERPSKNGGTYRLPVKLDHFLVTRTSRDAKGDLEIDEAAMGALKKDADGHVREIPIVLHSDRIDEVFPTSYALYSGKRLACRGDGQAAIRWEIDAKGQRTERSSEMKCPCPYLGATSGPICKPHGTLHCSIALPGVAVAGVVHKWRTTSIISIQRMIGSLQQILSLCGTLRGVPLWLKVSPITVTPANAPASTVYCCHVELRASDILAVQQQALRVAEMRHALADGVSDAAQYRLLLTPPAGDQETEAEQEEVAQEFHPESAAPVAAIMTPKAKEDPKPEAPKAELAKPKAEIMPKGENGNTWVGVVERMESKSGETKGKKWTCYKMWCEGGREFATFSETAATVASTAMANKEPILVRFSKTAKGDLAESVEPAFAAGEEPPF